MVRSRLPIFESLGMKDCVKNVLKWIESLVNPLFCYIFALEIKTQCRDKDNYVLKHINDKNEIGHVSYDTYVIHDGNEIMNYSKILK